MAVHPSVSRKVQQALKDSAAVLVRQNRHLVYKFPNGKIVTISLTASDKRAEQNQLKDIRKAAIQ